MKPILRLNEMVKAFPGVVANDHISLDLYPGEIHALLGENGAGKTTLMNILYGLIRPDEGEIEVRGAPAEFDSPSDAIESGIGMVHQHFMLVPVMTVAENVMLGRETTRRGGFLERGAAARQIDDISKRYGLEVDPNARVGELPVGVRQRVEIIKVLYREADVLILDEPTAVLTPQEVKQLFEVLRSLAAAGKSILFITHKLNEALQLANRVTVLRRGRVAGSTAPDRTSNEELASMMVGRDVSLVVEKRASDPADPVLRIKELWVDGEVGLPAVRGISLDVRAGEIVGLAGVQGNGQTELMEAVAGLRQAVAGEIEILGRDATGLSPRQVHELDVGYIPEDRHRDGLILNFSIEDNLVLNEYYHAPISRRGRLDRSAIRRRAEELKETFDIRASSVSESVDALSGGNQQKVIVARELSRPIKLLLALQPTRGLDVGSIEYIHQRIVAARDEGAAVFVVSTELDEIVALSDRIAVIFRGEIAGTLGQSEADRNRIGLLMAGAVG